MSETVPHENPLVNNKKLRQMFVSMVEARCLDEHVAALQRRRKTSLRLDSIRGQEACRVSTAIDLLPGDLVSDSQAGVVMNLILGADAGSLLKVWPPLSRTRRTAAYPRSSCRGSTMLRTGSVSRWVWRSRSRRGSERTSWLLMSWVAKLPVVLGDKYFRLRRSWICR